MKKNSLFTVSAIFLGISVLFTIIYNIPYLPKLEYGWITEITHISVYINIAELILTVLLLVGVITKKKLFFIIYFISNFILLTFTGIIHIGTVHINKLDALTAFSKFGLAIFNLFLLFFILAMFKWKEQLDLLDNTNKNNEHKNNKEYADDLIAYKELLDTGAISEEEFEQKKKEILNL